MANLLRLYTAIISSTNFERGKGQYFHHASEEERKEMRQRYKLLNSGSFGGGLCQSAKRCEASGRR